MFLTESLAAFEGQLNICIMQQTAAVDAFLASQASTWTLSLPYGHAEIDDDDAAAAVIALRDLRAAYRRDLAQPAWTQFLEQRASSSRAARLLHSEVEELGDAEDSSVLTDTHASSMVSALAAAELLLRRRCAVWK